MVRSPQRNNIMQVIASRNREAVSQRSPESPGSGAPWVQIKNNGLRQRCYTTNRERRLFNPCGVSVAVNQQPRVRGCAATPGLRCGTPLAACCDSTCIILASKGQGIVPCVRCGLHSEAAF
jgi:hypothetical protein